MKPILRIGVRELVAHVLRSGDLEFGLFAANRSVEAIRAHQKIQNARPAEYTPEVPVRHRREFSGFVLEIAGRIDGVFEYAGISRPAVEDQAIWFNQEQMDRFHHILVELTRNENIARDAGRYAVTSGAMAAAQQYSMGLMGLSYVYLLMGKLYGIMSRGASVKTRKLGPNKVEIISKPAPGVNEKIYQCENRMGTFESLAKSTFGRLSNSSGHLPS